MLRGTFRFAAAAAAGLLLGACGASTATTTGSSTSGNAFDQQLVGPPAKSTANQNLVPPTTPKKSKGKSTRKASRPSSTSSSTKTTGSSTPAGGTVTITHTITVNHTNTSTHTVTRTVATLPGGVPEDAQFPSRQGSVHLGSFQIAGGNVGCVMNSGSARCDIASRVWHPPGQPSSCHLAWGQGLFVSSGGGAGFVCAGDSVLSPTSTVVPAGRDVTVGSLTCQVRSVGVTCFNGAGHGFFIGRTGYTEF